MLKKLEILLKITTKRTLNLLQVLFILFFLFKKKLENDYNLCFKRHYLHKMI